MTHSLAVLQSLRFIDPDKIAYEFAINYCGPRNPAEMLLLDCGINAEQFAALADDALFQRKVRDYVKELKENGTSFQLKARIMAEELLKTNYKLAVAKDTAPSVAEKMIANTVRWAGLEKRPEGGDGSTTGAKINISINLGDSTPPQTLVVEIPTTPAVPPEGETS